jgi:hypothetical protein
MEEDEKTVQISQPTISCSVYRKINLGNYENLDVGATLVVPVDVANPLDLAAVQEKAVETMRDNLRVLSTEIKEIVDTVKNRREVTGGDNPKGRRK